MSWVAPVVGAAASILGDMMSQSGQQTTNAMSTANMLQQEQWQTAMSNTAMQRRVADLRAAGLNPMLAVNTPGAQVGSVSPAQLNNPDQAFGNLGSQVQGAMSQMNAVASAKKAAADADQAQTEAARARSTLPFSGPSAQASLDNLRRENDILFAQGSALEQQYRLSTHSLDQLAQDPEFAARLLELQYQQSKVDIQRANLALPRLENDAIWQKAHPQLAGWLSSGVPQGVAGGITSAVSAVKGTSLLPSMGGKLP